MYLTMTRAEREQFPSALHVGVISIPRDGCGPLTVPIWYDYRPGGDDTSIIVSMAPASRLSVDYGKR